jgi:hypothetical protein
MRPPVLAGITAVSVAVAVTIVRAGHELPIYPSFYPHEIEIRALPANEAAGALQQASIHAYLGSGVRFPRQLPETIGSVGSLGSFTVVRVNPRSAKLSEGHSRCDLAASLIRELAALAPDFILHPYPVTPFHGDYLYHVDLAEAAKERFAALAADPIRNLKIEARGSFARARPDWSRDDPDRDGEVLEVDAAALVLSTELATNGLIAPPWLKTGWFQASRLLGDAVIEAAQKERADHDAERLQQSDFGGLAERINLERDLVRSLTAQCDTVVAGYTVKREFFNAEYSAGVENIGFDSIEGLNSAMFIRTVKLKDFPWNGWLALALEDSPKAAWNPIAGMDDRFGRLLRFSIGDPALLAAPYDSGWMLNRIADLPSTSPP